MGSGAVGFIWVMVVVLALAWALSFMGAIPGLNFNLWINILLVLAVIGAIFNLFVVPFLGRSRTTRTEASASGTTTPTAAPGAVVPPAAGAVVPPGTVVPPAAPAAGAGQQEVVQETRDRTTM